MFLQSSRALINFSWLVPGSQKKTGFSPVAGNKGKLWLRRVFPRVENVSRHVSEG